MAWIRKTVERGLGRIAGTSARGRNAGLTRRRFFGTLLAGAVPGAAKATSVHAGTGLETLPREQLALMVRNFADLDDHADSALDAERQRMLDTITAVMPEAPDLLRLHRLYRPGMARSTCRPALPVDLSELHRACLMAQPVTFSYVDHAGKATRRTVQPIEVIHPANGIQLLSWCTKRDALRRFRLEAMSDLRIEPGSFAHMRHALIRAAIAEKEAQDQAFYLRSS